METNNFIRVYEKLASDDYCERMIDAWESLNQTSSNTYDVLRGQDSNGSTINRKDYAFFYEREETAKPLAQETYSILNIALQKYLDEHPSLGEYDLLSTGVKVQKTMPKGGFHKWHCEAMGNERTRILTWTIYLNDVPEGEGETEFLEYGVRVQPKKGDVCIFPASWQHTHRGNPVYTIDKYIATGWWYDHRSENY